MPLPLNSDVLASRLRDYSRENYLLLANVIKGVVLATATATAFHILGHFSDNRHEITAFICSVAAAIISYVTWTRGVLLTNSRFNTCDAVLPLLMGGIEVSLFAVLSTNAYWWFLVLAMHTGLAVLLVINRIKNTWEEDFAPDLRKPESEPNVYKEYVKWMKGDVVGALVGTGISLLFQGIMCLLWWRNQQLGNFVFFWLPVVPLIFIVIATMKATRQLWRLDGMISEASQSSDAHS